MTEIRGYVKNPKYARSPILTDFASLALLAWVSAKTSLGYARCNPARGDFWYVRFISSESPVRAPDVDVFRFQPNWALDVRLSFRRGFFVSAVVFYKGPYGAFATALQLRGRGNQRDRTDGSYMKPARLDPKKGV